MEGNASAKLETLLKKYGQERGATPEATTHQRFDASAKIERDKAITKRVSKAPQTGSEES